MNIFRDRSFIDLFAGAGGMTRGFVAAGFTPIKAVEADLAAAATYATNFGEDHVFAGQVEDFQDVPPAVVVIGGPPCQGFSNLGSRDEDDERNDLFEQFIRVAVAAKASMFVFENVKRFLNTRQCNDLIGLAESEGFAVAPFSLNAADFGTAQARNRAILLGSKLGKPTSPTITHSRDPSDDEIAWRTVRDAIADLPYAPTTSSLPSRTSSVLGHDVPGPYSLSEIHVGRTYRERSIRRFNHVGPGGNRFDIPEDLLADCWKRHKSGAGDVMGRLQWDRPSVTIRTEFFKPEKGRYLHPQWAKTGLKVNRALTHAEAARIQGFDHQHEWCGSKTQIARQIGNAVPPPLAVALARTVDLHLSANLDGESPTEEANSHQTAEVFA